MRLHIQQTHTAGDGPSSHSGDQWKGFSHWNARGGLYLVRYVFTTIHRICALKWFRINTGWGGLHADMWWCYVTVHYYYYYFIWCILEIRLLIDSLTSKLVWHSFCYMNGTLSELGGSFSTIIIHVVWVVDNWRLTFSSCLVIHLF